MKTLDQIRTGIPISSAPFPIYYRGSYYLTDNLTIDSGDAITINASGVTLDLNGFTISSNSSTANGSAILIVGGRTNVAIQNGSVISYVSNYGGGNYVGGGFVNGIYYSGNAPKSVRISNVAVTGVLSTAINVGTAGTFVQSCTVWTAGYLGIEAQYVSDSLAIDCGYNALLANTARNCYGQSGSTAIHAYDMAIDCVGVSIGASGFGIQTSLATNCRATAQGSDYALYADVAYNSTGSNSGNGSGIYAAEVASNCYGFGGNYGYGIKTTSALNCYGTGFTAPNATTVNSCYARATTLGIEANQVLNSYGQSDGTASNGYDAIAAVTVDNSQGLAKAGYGIIAENVLNSKGESTNNIGILATFTKLAR